VLEWNRTEMVLRWRERWAKLTNERLGELGPIDEPWPFGPITNPTI
jgi:hypothetical protein